MVYSPTPSPDKISEPFDKIILAIIAVALTELCKLLQSLLDYFEKIFLVRFYLNLLSFNTQFFVYNLRQSLLTLILLLLSFVSLVKVSPMKKVFSEKL